MELDPKEEASLGHCGYFSWTPNCMQRFLTPKWLLIAVMTLTFTQGFAVSGIKNVNTTTIERRFQLSSTQVAYMSSAYDIGAAMLGLVFGYLGTFAHKPRMIAISTAVMASGSFLMVLPHFLAGEYTIGSRDSDLCVLNGTSSSCSPGDTVNNYLGVFIFAQVMTSVGGAAIYTLIPPMLDENVKRIDSPFYLGCFLASAVVGTGFGLVGGGFLLQIYVDVGKDDVDITPDDPRWVGAWWIGFIISFFVMMITALMIGLFPRKLPSSIEFKDDRPSEAHGGYGEKETADEMFGHRPKDILVSLKILARNPVYILLTIVGIVEYILVTGFVVFFPKIIQFQFAQTPVMAAVWAGVIIVPASIFSFIIGGLIPKWLNLKIRGLICESLIFCVLATFLIFQFLLKCDIPKIAGISVPYYNSTLDMDVDNPDVVYSCNANCSCSTISYDPVCGQNEVTYFTPCHAGCLQNDDSGDNEEYSNCNCIAYETEIDPLFADAVSGVCETECDVLPYFLVLFLLINICTFIPATSGNSISLRCVPEKQMSFAYGLQNTLIRLLGQVPGPLIFGAIFDSSCWLWQETCEGQGSCWIYNVDSVAYGLTYLGLIMKTISSVCTFLTLVFYKPPVVEPDKKEIPENNAEHNNVQPSLDSNNTMASKTTDIPGIINVGSQNNGYVNDISSEEDQVTQF